MIDNVISVIQFIGSVSLLIMGLIGAYYSMKKKALLKIRRILFLIGMDIFMVSIVRMLYLPFHFVSSDNVIIVNGMIALVFLILILMEIANNEKWYER